MSSSSPGWSFPGRFIVLEGGDCAGKTTQAKHLRAFLGSQGIDVVSTREPGGSPLAEAIRGVVLGDWAEGVTPTTELLLMFAARAAHLNATILPALRAGRWVLCDRFVDSSVVFQGHARNVDLKHIEALQKIVLGDLVPDLTLVFDVEAAVAERRAVSRGGANRFDREGAAFMARVRQGFLQQASRDPQRYVVIDANRPQDEVQLAAQAALLPLLDDRQAA